MTPLAKVSITARPVTVELGRLLPGGKTLTIHTRLSISDYNTDSMRSTKCQYCASKLEEEQRGLQKPLEEEKRRKAFSVPFCENIWGKRSNCPIKQKLQPRNSCPGRNPWPCFQYPVYHATLVRHQCQPKLPRHRTQHSHCSQSKISFIHPVFP